MPGDPAALGPCGDGSRRCLGWESPSARNQRAEEGGGPQKMTRERRWWRPDDDTTLATRTSPPTCIRRGGHSQPQLLLTPSVRRLRMAPGDDLEKDPLMAEPEEAMEDNEPEKSLTDNDSVDNDQVPSRPDNAPVISPGTRREDHDPQFERLNKSQRRVSCQLSAVLHRASRHDKEVRAKVECFKAQLTATANSSHAYRRVTTMKGKANLLPTG
ncbi:hypothetical protein NDU88_003214 [Pleurodeles waltl]|uniref:Biogenesis of lysosome-related organelles complex 1 subunit 3 n=1 Tax=Pleurodeles waltl TaxID=8319 RepID=A0AAV7T4W8_PLEWA|nr:hypothetical protein NDU88_003214 [Pleurodeles waltl]